MSEPFGYIGIDFGTSNSHFAYCNLTDRPTPESVSMGKSGSMPTCVLWKKPAEREEHILSYGVKAQNEWIGLDNLERAALRFAFGFKPDLVQSERARKDAWAYLKMAYQDLSQSGLPRPVGPGGYSVVIGVPAEIGPEHRRITRELALQAGFGDVQCVEEPVGALCYHLHRGDITLNDAISGVLVIDFGGGTFDVALVNTQGLQEPWGDPTLGGRLFDDLFLQWVLDANPNVEVDEQELLVVWQRECRAQKEEFSSQWSSAVKQNRPLSNFKLPVEIGDRKVWLRNPTVEEFERRAKNYTPSHVVRKYLRGLDHLPAGLVIEQPINLFERIRQVLLRGHSLSELRGRFQTVILTGGSCWWPFMPEIVSDTLGVRQDNIIMSQNPEATIGSGLALYHVLQSRNVKRYTEIRQRQPQIKTDFSKAVSERLDHYAIQTADALIGGLMPRIEARYWEWYNHGGSLNAVEAYAQQVSQEFQTKEAPGIVQRQLDITNADLLKLIREYLEKFLVQNEIPRSVSTYVPESAKSLDELSSRSTLASTKIASSVSGMAAILALLGTIGLILVAGIKVKIIAAVVAAAIANPPLALALGIGALIGTIAAGESISGFVEAKIKAHEFNFVTRQMLYVALWESTFRAKLDEGRAQARAELRSAFRESVRKAAPVKPGETPQIPLEQLANDTFDQIINKVVQDLTVLDQLRGRTK